MSYINDALKKAQEEKDSRYSRYGYIINSSVWGAAGSRRNLRITAVLICTLIILSSAGAYTYYSLQDAGGEKPAGKTAAASTTQAVRPPADLSALYQRALERQRSGDFSGAEHDYRRIMELNPSHSEAFNNLGVILIMQNRNDEAFRVLAEAVRGNPFYADPHYNMACLHARSGRMSESLQCLATAVRLNPDAAKWAKDDRDLEGLRQMPEFKKVIG
ncbi:MAG: tetratricopeptide repeat protein [Syntrophales bacterium]|nr:tetratricopeptide repeat protein [Syntrophales bacterium]MDD5233145.1 tetratricopeptide repeat protein [Syntrophales bacterium]MDD5531331.1 tetratricopeptide repeat protein [Syntrophales bacterium]HPL63490.1 tetratricopeptide repeat protein [Syntrophales bacterium]